MDIVYNLEPTTPAFQVRNEYTDIFFYENIIEVVTAHGTYYKFDTFRITVPTVEGLEADVIARYDTWLDTAMYDYYKMRTEPLSLGEQVAQNTEGINGANLRIDDVEGSIEGIVTDLDDLGESTTARFELLEDSFTVEINKSGGNNLIKNSTMNSVDGVYIDWKTEFTQQLVSSDTPPTDPTTDVTYWYCELTSGSYERGIIYKWTGTIWEATTLDKEYFDTLNLSDNIIPYQNDETLNNSISGRFIKIDGKTTPYEVEHIFVASKNIPLDLTQNDMTFSCKIRQSIITGNALVGLLLVDTNDYNPDITGSFVAAYENYAIITPDNYQSLTDFQMSFTIPTKSNMLNAEFNVTEPTDTSRIWLYLETGLLKAKQYTAHVNAETEEVTYSWDDYADKYPLRLVADISSTMTIDEVYTYRPLLSTYYPSTIMYDDYICKTAVIALTFYPGFDIVYSATEPAAPHFNMYWGEDGDTVKRAKYNGSTYDWIDTGITTASTQGWLPAPPFPSTDGVPISGYYEVADLKMEYGTTKTMWNQAVGEIYGKVYSLNDRGLEIKSKDNVMLITEEAIKATYGNVETLYIDKDYIKGSNLDMGGTISIGQERPTEEEPTPALNNWEFKTQTIGGLKHLMLNKVGD